MRHHQQAKLQDDDASWVKGHVGNGVVSTVQDFSQNDEIAPDSSDGFDNIHSIDLDLL